MYTPQVTLILKAMKLAYRLCEVDNVNFNKWIKDQDLEMEMAVHLDSLLEEEAKQINQGSLI